MKRSMRVTCAAALAFAPMIGGLTGCTADRVPNVETRTYELMHLEDHAAMQMISPYVYDGREEAPGSMTAVDGKLTVRETPVWTHQFTLTFPIR